MTFEAVSVAAQVESTNKGDNNVAKTTATPAKRIWPDMADVLEAMGADEYVGWCLACGEERYGTEHDATNYPCEGCGQHAVQGAEVILFSHPEGGE